jgi:phospholipid/cholesterol/gamma-HCH transport system permease protein
MDSRTSYGSSLSGADPAQSGSTSPGPASVSLSSAESGVLRLSLAGDWQPGQPWPDLAQLRSIMAGAAKPRRVLCDAAAVSSWSSGLVAFVLNCREICLEHEAELDISTLPADLRGLLDMALAVPPSREARMADDAPHPVERMGRAALAWHGAVREAVSFLGECTLSLWAGLRGRAYFRRADLVLLLQQCGVDALPIVSLISFLVGLILAFVGAVQLEQFGATIYVADLVAIAMTREMGAVMVAIVMCGRTGAAFAAQLGTMKVNQEIDALRVFGISPVDFLVLPRLLALFLMIPLLTLYADVVGILGGVVVARVMLDLSLAEYWTQTLSALTLFHVGAGVIKSFAFGLIVAYTGCLRGLQCGNNAAAVGTATTSAVVIAISGVIAADALFAVVFNILGI